METTGTAEQLINEYKQRVKDEWGSQQTADAWQRHYAELKDQFAPITATLVEAAALTPGLQVLDLASGTGEPSLSIAKRVAPGGSVVATDLNPSMLSALRANAEGAGVSNIQTEPCDAHELPFPDGTFDRVTSRFGVMFFVETPRALAEAKRVLKPGGRLTFAVWGQPIPGSYFGSVALPFIKRLPEPPDADAPGPMRFAEPGKLASIYRQAGFQQVEESSHVLDTPFHGTPRQLFDEMVDLAVPFQRVLATLPDEVKSEAEGEVFANLHSLESDGAIRVTAPIVIVSGTAPG